MIKLQTFKVQAEASSSKTRSSSLEDDRRTASRYVNHLFAQWPTVTKRLHQTTCSSRSESGNYFIL